MKAYKNKKYQRLILCILGLIDAILIYFPHYALTDEHTKLNCVVFFILAVGLLWLPTDSRGALFVIDIFYEIGLVLLVVFIATVLSLHMWSVYLSIILILGTWVGMILFKNGPLVTKNRQLLVIRLVVMLIFALLAYLSGFLALLMTSPVGFMASGYTIYIGMTLFVYYLVLAASIWQKWFKGSIAWIMIMIAIILHMFFAYGISPETMLIPGICEVIVVLLVLRMNMLLKK